MRGQHVVTPQKVADAVATNWRGCNKNVGSHVYSFMRTVIAVAVVGLFACDQGVVNKPKPVAAASVSATPKPAPLMADGPFTAAAWDFVAPLLTGRANK